MSQNEDCVDGAEKPAINDDDDDNTQVSDRLVGSVSTATAMTCENNENNNVRESVENNHLSEQTECNEPFKTPVALDLRTVKCVSKKECTEIKREPPDTPPPQTSYSVLGDENIEGSCEEADLKLSGPPSIKTDPESVVQPAAVSRSAKSSKSPAEKLHDKTIPLPYKEPTWSGVADTPYSFEVLKSGVIVDRINLNTKSFYVVGRLSTCDVIMEHPSISRYHAVIQHRSTGDEVNPVGFYLYDLDSTHGTFLNKEPTKHRCYHRLRVGHMVKFGGSTRMFILQGPDEDQEEEFDLTVTELIKLRKKQEELLERLEKWEDEEGNNEERAKSDEIEETGIDWGMGEDAVEDEEDNLADNPFALEAIAPNEDLYIDDPKKTLRGWFEREGYDLEYNVEEKGYSQFLCRVQLPLDSPTGEPLVAEASVKGKKKEAVVACALEACRMLDRQGLLRQANHESRKRKQKNWEDEDFYDSDEDTFLDRTGTIEKKRQLRIQKAGKEASVAETFETLTAKYEALMAEINHIEDAIQKSANTESINLQLDDVDDLDAYMTSIRNEATLDKSSRTALKVKLSQLRQEEEKLQRLINIAKPTTLPELKRPSTGLASLRPTTRLKSENVEDVFSVPESIKKTGINKPKLHIGPVLKLDVKLSGDVPEERSMDVDQTETSCESKKEISVESLPATSKSPPCAEKNVSVSKQQTTDGSKKMPVIRPFQVAHTFPKRAAEENEDEKKKVQKKVHKEKDLRKQEYDASDPDYAVWLPPEGQTGDGRTSLNDKFGY